MDFLLLQESLIACGYSECAMNAERHQRSRHTRVSASWAGRAPTGRGGLPAGLVSSALLRLVGEVEPAVHLVAVVRVYVPLAAAALLHHEVDGARVGRIGLLIAVVDARGH